MMKKIIPPHTAPLTKFIRTGEGILVFAFNVALLVVPIVSNALTPQQSVKWAAILDGIAVVSRSGLKMVAAAQGAGVPAAAAAAQAPAPALPDTDAAAIAAGADLAPPAAGEPAWQGALQVAGDLSNVGTLVSDAEELATGPSASGSSPGAGPTAAAPLALGAGSGGDLPAAGDGAAQPAPFLIRLGT